MALAWLQFLGFGASSRGAAGSLTATILLAPTLSGETDCVCSLQGTVSLQPEEDDYALSVVD